MGVTFIGAERSEYGPASRSVASSAARTSSGQGPAVRAQGTSLAVFVNVTAVSGVAASMVLSLQWSVDGAVWASADPADAFTAVTATGAVVKTFQIKAPLYRLAWSVTGTTPSFTFVTMVTETGA
jgi:hypothetical protein